MAKANSDDVEIGEYQKSKDDSCFNSEDGTEVFRFLKETSGELVPIFRKYILDYKATV
jgi:hypothetical protein